MRGTLLDDDRENRFGSVIEDHGLAGYVDVLGTLLETPSSTPTTLPQGPPATRSAPPDADAGSAAVRLDRPLVTSDLRG